MRYFCLLLVSSLLLACGPTDSALGELPDNEERPVTAETSGPAPGTTPTPTATGDLDYELFGMGDLRVIDGCSCLVYPEDGSFDEGLLLALSLGNDTGNVAEMSIDGRQVTVPQISETSISNSRNTTYLYANSQYEVTAALTEENQTAPEVTEMSGTVTIREVETGRTARVRVLGECGC